MPRLTVFWDHPPVETPRPIAFLTIIQNSPPVDKPRLVNALPFPPGRELKFKVNPGTYQIVVDAQTRGVTAWKVIITPEGGEAVELPGNGSMTVQTVISL